MNISVSSHLISMNNSFISDKGNKTIYTKPFDNSYSKTASSYYLTNPLFYKSNFLIDKKISLRNSTDTSNIYFSGNIQKNKKKTKHNINHYAGCLVGGGIGDAFGAPVEFMKLKKIKKLYGEDGLKQLIQSKRFNGICITDDTQLTIFTADGLIKSAITNPSCQEPKYQIVFDSYRNWFKICTKNQKNNSGWISKISLLRGNNTSGKTCMQVLSQDEFGSLENPINDAKTSGGVMRVSPVGLMYYNNPKKAFDIAMKCAALTHGNPVAYLSAGFYAGLIANIISGKEIIDAANDTIKILEQKKDCQKVLDLIKKSISLAGDSSVSTEDAIKQLGEGWNGDEAIAIALYASLKSQGDFKNAIIIAINHNGDSDTVGSITGGIMGAYTGYDTIPLELKGKLSMEKNLIRLSQDLYLCGKNSKILKKKYM